MMIDVKACVAIAVLLTACSAEPGAASTNAAQPVENVATAAPVAPPPAAVEPAPPALKLSGPADDAAIAATLAEAKRQKMKGVELVRTQSFRITHANQPIATIVTGKGTMSDATYAGCFVAVRQGDDTQLIPTLGYGNYEAETCGGPTAVGILSLGEMVRIGIVFRGYSADAETRVPIVVEWNRADNTLLIDDALSSKALDTGATSITAMRRLVGRP